MLTIECLNPTGFFSYGQHETIPLDNQGVVLLTGLNRDRLTVTANASGKSSLLNTVAHLLYGENPTERGEDKIVNEVWGHGCWGMVKFTISGKRYRVILTRSWKGPYPDGTVKSEPCQIHEESNRYEGTCLYFDVFDGTRWADLRKTRVADTRVLLTSILGISYERFLATSYLAQQKGLAFIGGKNKDRMELITELTDMKVWDACVLEAKARLKTSEDKIGKLQSEQMALIAKADALSTTAIADTTMAKREVDRLTMDNTEFAREVEIKTTELDETAQKRIAMRQSIADAEAAQEAIAMEMAELAKRITAEDITLVKLAGARAQPAKDPNIANGNTTKMAELMNIKWGLERRLANMLSGAGRCDKCGTEVDEAHIIAEKFSITTELQATDVSIAALGGLMVANGKAVEDEKNELIDMKIKVSNDTRDDLQNKMATADAGFTAAKRKLIDLSAADLEWSAVGTKIQIDLIKLKQQIDTNTTAIANIEAALKRDADVKAQIAEAREEAAKIQTALDLLRESCAYYEAIIRGMGDKGVKAHKFGAMIQTLNDLVAENIKVLTDGQVQVWFSPWREKANAKSGDDVVPEIQIYVKEGPKEQVELALYSGMERQQIVIAIIRAFNKLAVLQGAGTNLLFMDEMFGMFDEASAATAIKLMNQLKNSDWGTIIIVTHNPDIKQVLDYDQLWTAEKQNHITTLKRETK